MSERTRFLLAVLALAGATACGHPDQRIVDQYFNAVNQGDNQTLQSFATVAFDKKVDRWKVNQTISEEKDEAPLPGLLAKVKDTDKAVTDNKKAFGAYNLDHFADLQAVQEARKKGEAVPAKFAASAQAWDTFSAKDRDLKKALTDAREAAEKEKRVVQKSVGELPDTDSLTGEAVTKKVGVSLTVGGQPQDYVMTLRKYNLKNASGGNVNSRWVVMGVTPGNS